MLTPTQHRVLSYVWRRNGTLRKEIGRDLKINASTVTRNLKPLMDVGIIEVAGTVSSGTVGRKSEVIKINENWKKFLGVSLEHSGITALLLDMKGNVLKEYERKLSVDSGNIVEVLKDAMKKFDAEVDVVAVGIPGIVKDGVVKYSEALGLRDFDLVEVMEREFRKRAYVVNDANAAVANFSQGYENMVCFLISIPYDLSEEVGIGAGIWLNGSLHTGTHGFAGETGKGFKMGCDGTIEDLVSRKVKPSRDFEKRMGERLGILSLFIDPQTVILSGDVNILPEDSISRIVETMKKYIPDELDVRIDLEGERSVARGAFMALLSEMLSNLEITEYYLGL